MSAIGDRAVDGRHLLGLRDHPDLQGLALALAADHLPAALAVPVDLRLVLSAIPLRSVVGLLADLPVVPVLVLQAALAAAQVSVLLGSAAVLASGPLLGSEATLAARLRVHLAAAQALAQVVDLLAHLQAEADPTVVLQQVRRREVHPVQDRERRSNLNRLPDGVVKNASLSHCVGDVGDYLKLG
jgi:hypothetical protein